MNAVLLLFGIAFGFLLSRARATDYDVIVGMFRFTDFHLMGVMATAIAVAAAGIHLLRRSRSQALMGCAVEVSAKPPHRWTLAAGMVFGAGWALTGA